MSTQPSPQRETDTGEPDNPAAADPDEHSDDRADGEARDSGENASKYAALFEDVTGESTITESQTTTIDSRLDERSSDESVSAYVATTTQERGFEDVIDDPETI